MAQFTGEYQPPAPVGQQLPMPPALDSLRDL